MSFTRAERRKAKLRLALIGPAKTGKSATALRIASALGQRIACIDSEHESLSLYAPTDKDSGFCPQGFDTVSLKTFSPQEYLKWIKQAEKDGYEVIVIDSLSHAWFGSGGAMEQVDNAMTRYKGNKFMAWGEVTPHHNALMNAIVQSPCHVIATMRTKTEYATEKDERGKVKPVKIGLAPIQRDGMEYEFTMIGELDADHNMIVTGTRCSLFDRAIINCPGPEVGQQLLAWLETGEAVPEKPVAPPDVPRTKPAPTPISPDQVQGILDLLQDAKANEAATCLEYSNNRVQQVQELTSDEATKLFLSIGDNTPISQRQGNDITAIYTAAGFDFDAMQADARKRIGILDPVRPFTWLEARRLLKKSLVATPLTPVEAAA